MSKKNADRSGILGIDSVSTCCSLSNLLTLLGDQVRLACSFFQKKHGSANLVITIQLPFHLFPLEKGAQLAPVRLLELFCLKPQCISVLGCLPSDMILVSFSLLL